MKSTDSNPFPLPSPAESEPVPGGVQVRDRWLVVFSFYTALLLEVAPFEADILFAWAWRPRDLASFAVIKLLSLSVILGPLALFVRFNGWRGLRLFPGRTITIGIVVGINLAMNALAIARMLR